MPEDCFSWSPVIDAKGAHVLSHPGIAGIFTTVWMEREASFCKREGEKRGQEEIAGIQWI